MGTHPYAGMAWMHMQLTAGFCKLGHDAYYMEVTSDWPYDPIRRTKVNDSQYAVPYIKKVAEGFGLEGRWAYRRGYSDKEWLGLSRERAEDLLANADVVFNVSGATLPRTREQLKIGNHVYFGTDPVHHEISIANGDEGCRLLIDQHEACATYGENIGTPESPIPPLPCLKAKTRQPVLMDLWATGPPARSEFTTVCNWKQNGYDIAFRGETYYWSKHYEFLKFIDLPTRTKQPIELAMGLVDSDQDRPTDRIRAVGMTADERKLLDDNGWRITNAHTFTMDPWRYRDYICASKAEFTVAKDQNVRLKSGWFSERCACYLAAGRPVVAQDTGFGTVIPTGEGLFAFNTSEEALAAIEMINGDYQKHSRAAHAIAQEYFKAETVLAKLLEDLGV
jgi:hypothetical protein